MTLRRASRFWGRKGGGSGIGFILPDPSNLLRVYSLRRYNTYAGNCIRVTRSSDLTSLEVGFMGNDLDIASITSFCSGTTGKIERWYDQSGSGTFARESVDAYRPIIYESGSIVTEGGKPSFRWPSRSSLNVTDPGIEFDFECAFFVYRLSAVQALNTLCRGATTNNQIWAAGNTGSVPGLNGFSIFDSTLKVSNTSENTNYNLSSFFGGSDDRVYTNGADLAISGTSIGIMKIAALGRADVANLSLNGKMHEVILYSTSQLANRVTIENMINSYYSIY